MVQTGSAPDTSTKTKNILQVLSTVLAGVLTDMPLKMWIHLAEIIKALKELIVTVGLRACVRPSDTLSSGHIFKTIGDNSMKSCIQIQGDMKRRIAQEP